MSRSGLHKEVRTVHGKKGAVKRSYWVKAKDTAAKAGAGVRRGAKAVAKVAKKHKGKIAAVAGAAALAGAAYAAHKKGIDVRKAPGAAQAAYDRGVKFHKAAQQAQWEPGKAWRHAAKGAAQGFRNHMRSS